MEPYWRLVINGLPTGERMHQTGPAVTCACGNGRSNREHHYWACDVAVAVVTAMTDGLQHWQPTLPGPLRANVWLMQPPRGVHQDLWDIVCLAGVAAMDYGRRLLYHPAAPEQRRAAAPAHAAARFWALLTQYCEIHAPRNWLGSALDNQPFITRSPDGRAMVSPPP